MTIYKWHLQKTLRGPSAEKVKIELGRENSDFLLLQMRYCVILLWGGTSLMYEGGRQNMYDMSDIWYDMSDISDNILLWGGTSLLYEGGRQNTSDMGGEVRWHEEKSGHPGLILNKKESDFFNWNLTNLNLMWYFQVTRGTEKWNESRNNRIFSGDNIGLVLVLSWKRQWEWKLF